MCINYFYATTAQYHNEALKMFPKVLSWKDLCKALGSSTYWIWILKIATYLLTRCSMPMAIIFVFKTLNQGRKSVGGNPKACTWKIHWTKEIDLWLQICSRPFSALHLTMPNGSYKGVHHVAFSVLGKVLLFHQGTKG